MKLNITDATGHPITKNSHIAYPTRRGSVMNLKTGVVQKIFARVTANGRTEILAKVKSANGRIVTLTNLGRAVVYES